MNNTTLLFIALRVPSITPLSQKLNPEKMAQELLIKQIGNKIDSINTLRIHKTLIFYKKNWLKRNVLLPDSLIDELESFTHRNALALNYGAKSQREDHICCQQCLKAHALKKAKEMALHPQMILLFEKIFDGEIGHSGYYTDSENLIKI